MLAKLIARELSPRVSRCYPYAAVADSVSKCEVLIAGAGPAGLATALYLMRARPELQGRVVALEKSAHPRFKTCAGGLIPKTMLALEELGLALEVPACTVMRGAARTPVGTVELDRGEPLCTIIRRDKFDARLARAARTSRTRNRRAYASDRRLAERRAGPCRDRSRSFRSARAGRRRRLRKPGSRRHLRRRQGIHRARADGGYSRRLRARRRVHRRALPL